MGYIYGSVLQYVATRDAAIAANTAGGVIDQAAVNTALTPLAATNEFAAAVMGAGAAAQAASAAGGGDAAAQLAAFVAARSATDAAAGLIITPELSAPSTAYGQKFSACHMIQVSFTVNINTCLPDAASHLTGTNVATANDPTATLIYSPVTLAANGQTIADTTGTLLPSIGILGSGESLQTGGICALWDIFTGGTAATAAIPGAVNSPYSEAAGTDGIQTDTAVEDCYGTATMNPGFISSGLEQSLKGNQMPFSDVTLSLGIAYTFQANNVEVTPRLDYYYRGEATQNVFDIQQNKIPAWDEINFRLNIVPTNGDWRIVFYGQNLTDERNITATGIGNSSVGHTNATFVREPRSFGFQFGLDF